MAMPESPETGSGAGEAAIFCRDLAAMTAFYRDIVGLEVVEGEHPETTVELRLGADFVAPAGGVALYASDEDEAGEDEVVSGPQRLALTVPDREALARAEAWFRANGLAPETTERAWMGWRGLTIRDPEGNRVELSAPLARHGNAAAWAGRR